MKTIHIINPAAGKGKFKEYLEIPEIKDNSYITLGFHDAERFAEDFARKNPDARFIVYGGDGTANEVVNGIMKSGNANTVQLKVVPTGTGNDFVKSIGQADKENEKIIKCDIMKYNDRYALNIINFGFDCNVVIKTQKYKKLPLISGSFAYILGVVDRLFHKLGEHFTFEYTDNNGKTNTYDGNCTMCVIANGKYYGGGFCASPLSDLNDGLMDVLIVKKVSRLTFLKLVSKYKSGLHLDKKTSKPIKIFEKYITYAKCTLLKVKGLKAICADGEIEDVSEVKLAIVPKAINIVC